MQQTQTKFNTITLSELKEKVKSNNPPVLINVLSEESFTKYNGLRICGSHWIPNAELEKKVPLMFPKNREIVVYCASYDCTASDKAAEILRGLGYTNVWVYKGGLKEWKEAGLPVESREELTSTTSCGCQ
jgi:rhodanese-related sulfurtransferase